MTPPSKVEYNLQYPWKVLIELKTCASFDEAQVDVARDQGSCAHSGRGQGT